MLVLITTTADWSTHFLKGTACMHRPSKGVRCQSTPKFKIPTSFCLPSLSAYNFKTQVSSVLWREVESERGDFLPIEMLDFRCLSGTFYLTVFKGILNFAS